MRRWIWFAVGIVSAAAAWVVWAKVVNGNSPPVDYALAETAVRIEPDYKEVTIPPNIAPLNFRITEEGTRYLAVASGGGDTEIRAASSDGRIRFPEKAWKRMLAATAGGDLCIQIFVRTKIGWQQYRTFMITVATEPIDRYLSYRLLRPQFNYYRDLGVYERDLEGFREREILHGRSFQDGCVNCHSFMHSKTDTMVLGVRTPVFGNGTIFIQNGKVDKIGANWGHTTWHPSGKLAAYSVYDVRQLFHTARTEVRDVVEFDSLLAYYRLDTRKTRTVPALADKNQLETQPYWSPDGKYLYFASAPKLWTDMKRFPPDRYAEVQYDIKRIPYDLEQDTWGEIETVVSSKDTGMSCLTPRVSPDGRFLLFVMCPYSCFALYQPASDLYLMDLASRSIRKLSCNSDYADSWHAWSVNSRWIAFSSKRPTGQFTRVYFAYIDESGSSRKPFILPQDDPDYYNDYLYAYNVPELALNAIEVRKADLLRAVRSGATLKVDAVTVATPKKENPETWKQKPQAGER
jgi:hypothetical protein